MVYLRVVWHLQESEPTDPIELWYEIENDQWAVRGFEIFFDGSVCKLGKEGLSAQIPPLDDLGKITEFDGYVVSKQDFEEMWDKADECKYGF